MCCMATERIIKAAGGVVWRKRPNGSPRDQAVDVLVIHRPSYDDWTFPKGKLEQGETLPVAAVREIAEETGLRVRLGVPLPTVEYSLAHGRKIVSYWCARVVGPADSPFAPNQEVDEVRWVSPREAQALLTYPHDLEVLERFRELREGRLHRSRTLVVVRHGKAQPRAGFGGDDLGRPLTDEGRKQAASLVPALGAYGVRRVVTSPAMRCALTVEPYAHSISTFLEIDDRLSESTRASLVQRSVTALLDRKPPVVLCTHRPTLPWVFDALGTPAHDLAVGEGVVVHHRRGEVVAIEPISGL